MKRTVRVHARLDEDRASKLEALARTTGGSVAGVKGSAVRDGYELAPADRKLSRAMSKALARAVEENGGRGGGILRITQGERVLFEGAAGHTARAKSVGRNTKVPKIGPETPFDIASITKTFTAAVIMQLVESKKLALDTSLEALGFGELGFDRKITVRQLLGHTSGLSDYWKDPAFIEAFDEDPDRRWQPRELLDYAKQAKRGYHYSDTNYVLLGLIIEKLEAAQLEDVFTRRLFEPLGLGDTFFSHGSRSAPHQAHRFEGKDDLFGRPHQSADWAGGGLVSTARDLEKFFRSLVDRSQLFRSERSPTKNKHVSYGLGVFEIELGKGRGSLWGHDGHGNSFAYYWPERDLFFAGTLNQTEADWWPLVEAAISKLHQK